MAGGKKKRRKPYQSVSRAAAAESSRAPRSSARVRFMLPCDWAGNGERRVYAGCCKRRPWRRQQRRRRRRRRRRAAAEGGRPQRQSPPFCRARGRRQLSPALAPVGSAQKSSGQRVGLAGRSVEGWVMIQFRERKAWRSAGRQLHPPAAAASDGPMRQRPDLVLRDRLQQISSHSPPCLTAGRSCSLRQPCWLPASSQSRPLPPPPATPPRPRASASARL